MEVNETINKWFDEVKRKLTGGKTYYKQLELDVDKLCGGVVVLLENYVQSIFLLLDKGKILPAKALLRVISDVSIKCLWCLKGLDLSEEEFNTRFDEWRRCSLSERKTLMEKELIVLDEEYGSEVSGLKTELKKQIAAIESAGIAKKERFNITDKLGQDVWKTQYKLNLVALYRSFHEAVHPDLVIFQRTMQESDGKIIYRGDVEEPPERLKIFCLVILGYLFEAIYSRNKWDFSEFEKDIKQIRKYTEE